MDCPFKTQRWRSAILIIAMAAPAAALDNVAPRMHIAGRPDETFATIQAAIDAAVAGDVIQIPAGRFDERLTIAKAVKLVGAGANDTVIGPTAEGQAALREDFERIGQSIEDAARAAEAADPPKTYTEDEVAATKRQYEEMKLIYEQYAQPVVHISGATGVALRSLKVTMPDTPREGAGLMVAGAVSVTGGGVRMENCAVVGCLSNGINSGSTARLEVVDCLVAACWGTGVDVSYAQDHNVLISNCDIRNNYHYNVAPGGGVIEGCRISGTAWSGITGGASRIERNVIFDNASRGIYSAGANVTVKHNLIYRNGAGASCWSAEKPHYEGNLFLDNAEVALAVNGPAEPAIRKNLIVGSPFGVRYGPMGATKGEKPPATEFHIEGNIFWQVETPAVLYKSRAADAEPQPIPLAADASNRVADPQVAIGPEQQVVLAPDSPARELGLEPLAGLSLRSRWPLTPEEQAMIPDDGTRDSPKWKMRPKR